MIHFILQMYQSSSGMVLKCSNRKQDNMNQLFLNYSENRRISFPNLIQNVSYKIDVFEISVPSGFYVNVSILHFIYHGFRISSCRYAGITAYNWVYRSYKEISTICKPHYSIYKSCKIYFKTSKMLLVFYQYQDYCTNEVEILLSVTKCSPLPFNLLPYYQIWQICQICQLC